MSKFDLIMPKLGESVEEATITKWLVKPGDTVEEDQPLVELATDKVDSEIPSPVDGTITKLLYDEGDLVAVGKVIAHIGMGDDVEVDDSPEPEAENETKEELVEEKSEKLDVNKSDRFYSPLVRSIAEKENITLKELDSIQGSGKDGRVRKEDILNYIENRGTAPRKSIDEVKKPLPKPAKVDIKVNEGDEVIPMERMRKLIADHMVHSVHTSAMVTSMVEADVTNMVNWRKKVKNSFQEKYGEKITFMPIITEAVAKALRDFPQVNASTDGDNIILRKNVNIGMAVALPGYNLIVPVVKNADQKNLVGLTKDINSLADKARNNKLSPDDISGGTFSISNFGSFKNVMGTPIINQPEVAILAVGSIEKKPAVIETADGDMIAIRHKMYLSLTYDHRIVDGALGGAFVRKIADYLEEFDTNQTI
jgi:2-oxoglutarate dehydrogenase E2 component (dihydrolipoamide succinyltransferase)